MSESSPPRFNHVALTVDAELLSGRRRAEIVSFYAEVFGWKEVEEMRAEGSCLVLQCHLFDQFVFLVSGSEVTRCAPMDHFGLAVSTLRELEDIVSRAQAYREKDARVEVEGHEVEKYGSVQVHNAYLRYLLPMRIELQHFELTAA